MPAYEADLCIIGGGISAALLAQRVHANGVPEPR